MMQPARPALGDHGRAASLAIAPTSGERLTSLIIDYGVLRLAPLGKAGEIQRPITEVDKLTVVNGRGFPGLIRIVMEPVGVIEESTQFRGRRRAASIRDRQR
jgi:hypothetical protein